MGLGRAGRALARAAVGTRVLSADTSAARRRVSRARPLPLWRLVERTLVRDPWAWSPVPVLVAVSLGLASRTPEVALLSLYGVAQLVLPPLVLVLAVPTLAARGAWALWGPAMRRPGLAFVASALGVALGAGWPAAFAALIAAVIAGVPPVQALVLVAAVLLTVLLWALVAALLAALTLDPTRAMAGGVALWALGAIVYEPALVALAVSAADRPFEPLLAIALLVNPAELGRVALVRSLEVPVFAGPTGVLVARWLGDAPLVWAAAATVVASGLLAVLAGWAFARRER